MSGVDEISLMEWPRAGSGVVNKPAPFPDRMSYKATEPGSVCALSLSLSLNFIFSMCVVMLTRTTFCVVLFCDICVFCLLVVLVKLSVPVQAIDWKDSSPK